MRKLFLLFLPLTWCEAAIHFVPADFPTIQEALNALADGDTVMVDTGFYAEALQAPMLSFVLKGNLVADTGDYARPVVDPSTLPNPTTLACLILPSGSHAVVEDFVFHNGPEMFPDRPLNSVGGVRNNSWDATFRRCLFDSTIFGLRPNPGRLNVIDCEFRDITRICIHTYTLSTRIFADGCTFSKIPNSGGSYLVNVFDSSKVQNCWFKETVGSNMLEFSGHGVLVRDCLFGAAPSLTHVALEGFSLYGCRVENNVFVSLDVQLAAADLQCVGEAGDTSLIAGNLFLNNTAIFSGGGGGMILTADGEPGTVVVKDNVFINCIGLELYDALELMGDPLILHNRFIGGFGAITPADAIAHSTAFGGGAVFRDNLFDSTDKALEVWGPNAADCRWNWWDDESGPFHEQLNPEGQGDIVTGENVLLWPWHTDTLFYLDAPERPPQMPTSFELEVYPNPFNAVATLKLYVDQPGIYRVDAYNVLGQQVEEIWSGPLAIDKQVVWNASALGSDIYFVRVWQVIGNRPKAMEKVVLIK